MATNQLLLSICLALFSCSQGSDLKGRTHSRSSAAESTIEDTSGNVKINDEKKNPQEKPSCAQVPLNDPTPDNGQLILSVGENIDPCSVSGYVVGNTEARLERVSTHQFVINQVPPGTSDIIVIASTLAVNNDSLGLIDSTPRADRGIRIKQVFINKGQRIDLSEIALPKMGSLNGQVKSIEKNDSIAVQVSIPGTFFQTTTDNNGYYRLNSLPVGEHSILFEKKGFDSNKIDGMIIMSESASLLDIDLIKTPVIEASGEGSAAEESDDDEGDQDVEDQGGGLIEMPGTAGASAIGEPGSSDLSCNSCACSNSWCNKNCNKCLSTCQKCRRNSCKPTSSCKNCQGCKTSSNSCDGYTANSPKCKTKWGIDNCSACRRCENCAKGETCNTDYCNSQCVSNCIN